jgi:hypothetical protein
MTGYDFSKSSRSFGTPTEAVNPYRYLFERSRTSFDDHRQSISSFKHEITIYDHNGRSTINYEGAKSSHTLLSLADADIVILALDPTRVSLYSDPKLDEDSYFLLEQEAYAKLVKDLFMVLENIRPDKIRYYAVCITKADQITDGIYRSPEGLIQYYFGEAMIKALQVPDKERIRVFTTSSVGFMADSDALQKNRITTLPLLI